MSAEAAQPSKAALTTSDHAQAFSDSQQPAKDVTGQTGAHDIEVPSWVQAVDRSEANDGRSQPWKKAVGSVAEDRHFLGFREWDSSFPGHDFAGGKCTCNGAGTCSTCMTVTFTG